MTDPQTTEAADAELELYLLAFRNDWIKAGQPSALMTIKLVKEIERLRDHVAALSAELDGAASNRFYDQRDAYFEGVKDGR